jgi:[NiFe] hydrogenase diaphorase moiety large subunit
MDIVQAVQNKLGYIPQAAISLIAGHLGIHVVEIEDMVSFYTFLTREPKGRFQIYLSRTPISLMRGAADVMRAFETALNTQAGTSSADGLFSLDWTNDVGMADQEPAGLINGTVVTGLVPADAAMIIGALRANATGVVASILPGGDGPVSMLRQARVAHSIAQAGPVIFSGGAAGDGLRAALAMAPEEVIDAITASKLRGRGGAGFPTGLKWRVCRQAASDRRYVICNADEGEPGTFKDRVLLTELPDAVFDGMTIAAYATAATQGLVYLRREYAYLYHSLQAVLSRRRASGLLGRAIGGREGFDFDIRIQLGAGAYMCGEESSLIESLEGKRGAPRDRPPFPTERGYLAQPTIVDNVETLVCAARILEKGADWFKSHGTRESTGTKLVSIAGDCPRPGVYEVPYGITINSLLDMVGAPEAAFVQVSGPSGQCIGPKDYGRCIGFEDLPSNGSMMVFGPGRDVLDVVHQFAGFFVEESCGWCTPCRVGTTLMKQELEKILANRSTLADVAALHTLSNTVMRMSRCGLGQTAANPILTTMRNFPEAYEARLQPEPFVPRVTLPEATREASMIRQGEPAMETEG